MLPEDGQQFGFDKVAGALDISHIQMAKYLQAADAALREAIVSEAKAPEAKIWREPAARQDTARGAIAVHCAVPLKGRELAPGLATHIVGNPDKDYGNTYRAATFKGEADSVALLTGESQVAFVVMPGAAPHIAGNRLRGLGVADKVRSAVAPNVPTMIEAGVPDHVAVQWNGLLVPSKTPQAIQDKLYKEWVAAVKSPDVVQRIRAEGAEPSGNTPAEFNAFFRAEAAKWARVIKQAGIRLE
jgi:hypothetical protein